MLVASALALGTAYVITPVVVQPMIPVFRAAITLLDDRFVIDDARISHDEGHETLRFRANLARAVQVKGRLIYPIGWNGTRAGGCANTMVTLLGGFGIASFDTSIDHVPISKLC